jgi:hypothetical protein
VSGTTVKNNTEDFAKIKKLPLTGMKEHYERQYRQHQLQIFAKFKNIDSQRFFHSSLYDEEKFKLMSQHFDLKLADISEQKSHATSKSVSDIIDAQKYLF